MTISYAYCAEQKILNQTDQACFTSFILVPRLCMGLPKQMQHYNNNKLNATTCDLSFTYWPIYLTDVHHKPQC